MHVHVHITIYIAQRDIHVHVNVQGQHKSVFSNPGHSTGSKVMHGIIIAWKEGEPGDKAI